MMSVWALPTKAGRITALVSLLLIATVAGGHAAGPDAAPAQPVISIFSPQDGARFSGGQQKIVYEVRVPSGRAVDRVDVLIDGQPVANARGVERIDEPGATPGASAAELVVPLPNKDVTVSLVAHAGELVSQPATIKLAWARPSNWPKLYAVVVGVSRYDNKSFALQYAAKDATDFAGALKAQSGGLYADVQAKLLTDGDVTRKNVLGALRWLQQQVTSNDIGVVYMAGHGLTDEVGNFWFLPVNANPDDFDLTIAKDDILRTLDTLAGKALLFIDACHAASTAAKSGARGSADMDSVLRAFTGVNRGIVTFASSQGREISLERADWGNGAFTKALVEGLADGKAAGEDSLEITLSGLNYYVANRVKELTGGAQHPVMNQGNVADFPIAMLRAPKPGVGGVGPGNPTAGEAQAAYEAAAKIGTRDAYQAIVDSFPKTVQAKLALAAIAALPEEGVVVEPPPPGGRIPTATIPGGTAADEAALGLSADEKKGVQGILSALGFETGGVSGTFNPATRNAIRNFQYAQGHDPTGYLNRAELDALGANAEHAKQVMGERASFVSVADLPKGADPRLVRAVSVLSDHAIKYGYFEGHLYIAVVATDTLWQESRALAQRAGGDLATLTSKGENDFVYGLIEKDPRFWAIDREKIASEGFFASGPHFGLFQEGNAKTSAVGWRWVDGTPVKFTRWGPLHQPNEVDLFHQDVGVGAFGGRNKANAPLPTWQDHRIFTQGAPGFIMEVGPLPQAG